MLRFWSITYGDIMIPAGYREFCRRLEKVRLYTGTPFILVSGRYLRVNDSWGYDPLTFMIQHNLGLSLPEKLVRMVREDMDDTWKACFCTRDLLRKAAGV